MIAGWVLSVLCCHAMGVFEGSMVEGVTEVEECITNYTNPALYNVGPHLVLKNWTLTHTGLSVFCRTNVSDLYRCIEPHLEAEGDLTSSITRTFEHLCDENQQPEWLRHAACVPSDIGTCLIELQNRGSVVTLYGVDHEKIPGHHCRLMKDYVTCVYSNIEEVEACGTAAADWHKSLIRVQWAAYSPINTCDIFDDIKVIAPPPDVAGVMACMQNYTDGAVYNVGLHLVLKNHTMTDTQVSQFCKTNVSDLHTCIEPYRETEAKTLTESLTKTFEHLCDKNQQKEWVKHSECARAEDMDRPTCVAVLQDKGAWITLYELKVDDEKVPQVGDERVPDQCRLMKDYVKCVDGNTEEVCGKAAADWHTGAIRKIWRPFKGIITCDVYGPTGGTAGLVTGIVVGLLFICICGFLIWYSPKKTCNQSQRQLRASTAL